jgi:K+-transporting ATPase ATPase B chain
VALMVCLSPTTIGGLLSAIGIAGMNRLLRANVIAMSGRAVEAAGDVDVMLLDKTGTITHGNRQAHDFIPARGITQHELLEAVLLSSLSDMTPEGKSIVMLATRKAGANRVRALPEDAELIEFSAETRVSGVKFPGRIILKGAPDAIGEHLKPYNTTIPDDVLKAVDSIARTGGTPLVVVDTTRVLGAVHLKDVVKSGIRERLADLRKMGIKSIMITGDSPITAAAIAAEAGVDDYQAEATPEHKLKMIRAMQADGALVAMVGDGTNDAPALAQSDVAVCMNSGTQAAKEAANMIDLDSDPTKLIEIVEIGKQLLITRGALTTFSISNDIAKYFAIIPAAFVSTYPSLAALNIMGLASPLSAILAALIFNALLIIGLIPLALKGVQYRPMPAAALLRRNLSIYGVGGLVLPFIGIKLINELLVALGLF